MARQLAVAAEHAVSDSRRDGLLPSLWATGRWALSNQQPLGVETERLHGVYMTKIHGRS